MMTNSHLILTIPIKMLIYIILLFYYLGITFFFGFFTLIFILLITFCIQRKVGEIEEKKLGEQDKRIQLSAEAINNIREIKIYSWEEEYLRRLLSIREKEVEFIWKKSFLNCFATFFYWMTPIAISIVSLGVYQYYNQSNMKLSEIFTMITIFNNLQESLSHLPIFIQLVIETLISLKRIQVYTYLLKRHFFYKMK
jgi:ABC-type bacteriocin/lantibiotic exporter with double-glycine peptidase domain